MTLILIIDDEAINYQLIEHALASLNCELHFAENGASGVARARRLLPDLIITDLVMPEMDGYEVTRVLRRDPQFAATPILVLTARSGLHDKLKSFEAGADDHLTKPFEEAELAARITSLLKRVTTVKLSPGEAPPPKEARMIAVHSLRGGVGSSSLAVNLGLGLLALWREPTILLELALTAGPIALMLNMTLKRTWADLAGFTAADLNSEALHSIIGDHESGLQFIAAPTFPSEAEALRSETFGAALQIVKTQYEYVVADLPHDFSDFAIRALDAADVIIMLCSPDMASVRAVNAALDTYEKLGYPKEKIRFVLNAVFPYSNLARDQIESAIGMPVFATIPYTPDVFVDAINLGQPVIQHKSGLPIASLLQDFAFHMSKDAHKKSMPESPTAAWSGVYERYKARRK
jgi:pilus assembly protein CpaE